MATRTNAPTRFSHYCLWRRSGSATELIHAEHEPPSAAYWQLTRFDVMVMTAEAPYAEELLSRKLGIRMTDSGSGCGNRSVNEIEKN